MQSIYKRTDMKDIATRWRGSVIVLLVACAIGIAETNCHFMTAPHEGGHVMAAWLVGHGVKQFQVDFIDESSALISKTKSFVDGGSDGKDSASSGQDNATEGARVSGARDGRNGFVIYDSYLTLVNETTLPNLDSYARCGGSEARARGAPTSDPLLRDALRDARETQRVRRSRQWHIRMTLSTAVVSRPAARTAAREWLVLACRARGPLGATLGAVCATHTTRRQYCRGVLASCPPRRPQRGDDALPAPGAAQVRSRTLVLGAACIRQR